MNNNLVVVLSNKCPIFKICSSCGEYLRELGKVYELNQVCNSDESILDAQRCIYVHYYDKRLCFEDLSEKTMYTSVTPAEAIRKTLSYLHQEASIFDDSSVILHGSAISFNNVNILFLAPSKTGKSTLISYLLLSRLGQLISEDMSILNVKTFRTPCIPRNVLLRPGGYNLISKVCCTDQNKFTYLPNLEKYAFQPPTHNEKEVAIDWIISLEREEGDVFPHLAVASPKILVDNLYNTRNLLGSTMLCAGISNGSKLFTLHYSDFSQVPLVLNRFFEQSREIN